MFLWFIRELRQAGLEARQQWPFNVEKLGYVTICKFIDRVMNENPRRKRELLGGEEAQRKAKAGDGTGRPDLKAFDRVECDAHKLDARMIVQIPSPHGGYVERVIHRLWVVVIIEVATRVVLGYRLSLRRECGAEDVLRAIKSALTRWQPRELQFSGHAYDEDAGVPSARHERYVGACWDEFSVDGAMANICGQVEAQLRDVVGARLLKPQDPTSFSCRRSKDDRPFVESFFKRLASGGFHRLSSTTGSKPQDKRGGDPDRAAVETKFQLEYAEELLDTFIANYNATPHSGLSYRSPLEQLDFETTRRSAKIRIADPWDVKRLVGLRKLCTVLGGTDTGRRPHFNFANARYSAEWLCLRTDLVGKLLWVQVEDEDDARYAMVSTRDGQFLGAVRAAPPWHLTPHTLYIRQSIRALEKRRHLHLSSSCDAVEELIRYAESSKNRRLPPHPAYLEALRVLRMHAEKLAGESMVTIARDSATPISEEKNLGQRPGKKTVPEHAPAPAPAEAKRELPAMQMAKTW